MEWEAQKENLKVKTEIMESGKRIIMLWSELDNDITFQNVIRRIEEMERDGRLSIQK